MQRITRLLSVLLLLLLTEYVVSACGSDENGSDENTSDKNGIDLIGVYAAGWTPALKNYHTELLTKALDYSAAKYGEYRIVPYTKKLTVEREIAEVGRGKLFQVVFLSQARFKNDTHGKAVDLAFPLHQGLLGLRKLIIRKSDNERFTNTKSKKDFYMLRAGQGLQWPDINAYRNAGVQVVGGVSVDKLLLMLTMNRFDYFPLSILEIDELIAHYPEFHNVLDIHDNSYIYYPMPIHITVTKTCPKIVNRVNFGIDIMKKKGDLDRIFRKYFNQKLVELSDSRNVVFMLKNPLFSEEENKRLSSWFVSKYLSNHDNIISIESE